MKLIYVWRTTLVVMILNLFYMIGAYLVVCFNHPTVQFEVPFLITCAVLLIGLTVTGLTKLFNHWRKDDHETPESPAS